MGYAIDSDSATINAVNLTQQSGDPANPATSHWKLYAKSGGLYLIKSDGTVTGPFAAATSGAVVRASHTKVTGSVLASLTYNPSGSCNHVLLIITARDDTASTGGSFVMAQFNSDTGSNYDNQIIGTGATTSTPAETLAASTAKVGVLIQGGASAGYWGSSVTWFHNVNGTSADKTWRGQAVWKTGTTSGTEFIEDYGGHWRNTNALTAIKIMPTSGNFAIGTEIDIYEYT